MCYVIISITFEKSSKSYFCWLTFTSFVCPVARLFPRVTLPRRHYRARRHRANITAHDATAPTLPRTTPPRQHYRARRYCAGHYRAGHYRALRLSRTTLPRIDIIAHDTTADDIYAEIF